MDAKKLCCFIGFICLFSTCNNPINDREDDNSNIVRKELFDGYVQKGPFVSGSSVSIQELDALLNQTGKSYSTTILNNSGSFEHKNFELISNYAQLRADGYYFNEVTGKSSAGQISLYALVDISNANSANINVLTHLERSRVEYLVKEAMKPFEEAKKQAQQEVLDIFSLSLPASPVSESLNLTDNALLLAISCILQGSLQTGDVVELMANISDDIRTDGNLDNKTLGSQLVNNAVTVSLPDVRKNMEDKYAEMNSTITVPNFEQYVRQFLDNTSYQQNTFITYPKQGAFGDNILSDEATSVVAGQTYSMTAVIPNGFKLKVVLQAGEWYYTSLPAPVNWTVSAFDFSKEMQEFTVTESGMTSDLCFWPNRGQWNEADQKYYTNIEYFENNAKEPVRTKRLEIIGSHPVDPGVVDSLDFYNGNNQTFIISNLFLRP